MKNIIAFAGSNSKQSINKQFAIYASTLVVNAKVTILDLNDFDMPLFGVDLETQMGQPQNAYKFLKHIKDSDGIIVSLAEHNGAYTAVFKNLLDWMSRIDGKVFAGKPMLLMATSNGGRGGASVLAIAKDRFPRHDANIVASFSLPNFKDNFSEGRITNSELNENLINEVNKFENAL